MNGFVWVHKSPQSLPLPGSAIGKTIVTSSGDKDEEGFDAESVYSNVNDVRLQSFSLVHNSFHLRFA